MSRRQKISRLAIGAVVVVGFVMLVIDNVHFDPTTGIVLRGELELSWETPTENSDSSPVDDLAGYAIHCWNAESRETQTNIIEDPGVTRYRVDHLWPGTYQCAVSAVMGDGSQSALSNVVTRTVP